jgi:osmotically-inducible protein OsmY
MRLLAAFGVVGLSVGTAGLAFAEAQPLAGGVLAAAPYAGTTPQPQEQKRVVTDASITADIKAKLEASQLLRHSEVNIVTEGGVVTLIGVVPSDFARSQAIDLAKQTPGVVRVDDMLRLNIASPEAPSRN